MITQLDNLKFGFVPFEISYFTTKSHNVSHKKMQTPTHHNMTCYDII